MGVLFQQSDFLTGQMGDEAPATVEVECYKCEPTGDPHGGENCVTQGFVTEGIESCGPNEFGDDPMCGNTCEPPIAVAEVECYKCVPQDGVDPQNGEDCQAMDLIPGDQNCPNGQYTDDNTCNNECIEAPAVVEIQCYKCFDRDDTNPDAGQDCQATDLINGDETCPQGEYADDATCNNECRKEVVPPEAVCGNGVQEEGEECDSSKKCRDDCTCGFGSVPDELYGGCRCYIETPSAGGRCCESLDDNGNGVIDDPEEASVSRGPGRSCNGTICTWCERSTCFEVVSPWCADCDDPNANLDDEDDDPNWTRDPACVCSRPDNINCTATYCTEPYTGDCDNKCTEAHELDCYVETSGDRVLRGEYTASLVCDYGLNSETAYCTHISGGSGGGGTPGGGGATGTQDGGQGGAVGDTSGGTSGETGDANGGGGSSQGNSQSAIASQVSSQLSQLSQASNNSSQFSISLASVSSVLSQQSSSNLSNQSSVSSGNSSSTVSSNQSSDGSSLSSASSLSLGGSSSDQSLSFSVSSSSFSLALSSSFSSFPLSSSSSSSTSSSLVSASVSSSFSFEPPGLSSANSQSFSIASDTNSSTFNSGASSSFSVAVSFSVPVSRSSQSGPTLSLPSQSSVPSDTDDDGDGDNDDGIPDNDDSSDQDDDGDGDNDDGIPNNQGPDRNRPTLVASASICGNGSLEPGEECDDSNRRNDDGCSAECLLEVGICGDGIVQKLLGEQCEQISHDTSLPYSCVRCRFVSTTCGDGTVDPGEECDDGTSNSTSANANCRPDCSFGRCGDGVLDSTELCDDGNRISGDGCDRYCVSEMTQVAADQESSARTISFVNGQTLQYGRQQNVAFPFSPTGQVLPYQLPLAQLQPLVQGQAPVGDTGPAAVAVIGTGAAAGWSWVRRRKKK